MFRVTQMGRLLTPWFYGWNIIGTGMTFQAILFGMIFFSFTMWAPEWAEEFNTPLSEVMLIIIIIGVAGGLISPFAGRAMDHMSIRVLVCFGVLSASLGFVMISQVTAVWQIMVIYGTFINVGTVIAGPLAAQTLAAKWFRKRRSFAIGLSTTGTSIGGFLFPPLVTYLFLTYGWRTAHLILALVMVVVVIPLVWTVVRNSPEDRGVAPEDDVKPHADGSAPTVFPNWTTKTILQERNFWAMVLAFIPMMIAFGGIQQNLKPIATDLGIGTQDASYLVSVMAATMIGGKLFFARQADYWDHRLLFWVALAILSVAIGLILTQPDFVLLLVISGLLGVAAGAFLPLFGAIISSRFGADGYGRVAGLLGPFMMVGAVGPYIPAAIRDSTGNYDLALQIFLVIIIPSACAIAFLKPLLGSAKSAAVPGDCPGS
jgi:MFS family permease